MRCTYIQNKGLQIIPNTRSRPHVTCAAVCMCGRRVSVADVFRQYDNWFTKIEYLNKFQKDV